ncbi:MAG: hypothetical protein D6714_12075, partial [Bacteroidetes bacterium]
MAPAFSQVSVTGKTLVCPNATESYAVPSAPGDAYVWSLSSGGTLLNNGAPEVEVKWDTGAPGSGPHLLKVTIQNGNATATASLDVSIQATVPMSCPNKVNISLGPDGTSTIYPQTLLNANLPAYDNFVVEVNDAQGNSYGDQVHCEHIGEVMTGKVTDLCSGNTCWSYLVVEDKSGPTFDCPTQPTPMLCDQDFEQYPHPDCWDNCTNANQLLVVFLGQTIDDSNVCQEVWVTKNWMAIDAYGNESECEQVLKITSPNNVDFPSDTVWSCDTYAAFPNITDAAALADSLSETGSGVPGGVNGLYCAYNFNFSDDTLSACGNSFKIIRTWFVFNWCTGQVLVEDADGDTNEQLIEVMDFTPPELTLDPIILNANLKGSVGMLCRSTGLLPPATVTDNCNGFTTRIYTPVGEAVYVNDEDGAEGGYIPFPGLAIGIHEVTYEATDDCGNIGQKKVLIQVKDLKAPNAICDYITDANLTNEGTIEVFAETFDDGSIDNCCIDRFEVKRMGEPDAAFAPSIIFDCADSEETVVMRVYDCFDNYNDCMVLVQVNDKQAPVCVAPPDLTVDCTAIPVGLELSDSETLTELFGEASASDNCQNTLEELTATGNIYCGDGFINRQFVATDPAGNVSASCFQHITIEGKADWVIHFPADWSGACGGTDDSQGVWFENAGCDLFAVSWSDQFYNTSSDSACMQIIRTWEVINWCKYLPGMTAFAVPHQPGGDSISHVTHGNFSYFTYQQTIELTDGDPPVLTYTGDHEFCSLDDDCATGEVHLPLQVQDACTDDLPVKYVLDLHADGVPDGSGNGIFNGTLPLGEHLLVYEVVDGCGNEADLEVPFSVKDCKKPVAYCENGLIVELSQAGEVEVWAKDLNFNSSDNCPGDLTFSFSPDTTVQALTFDCLDVDDIQYVQLWVTDAAGNQDFCNTWIDIQDNFLDCHPGNNPLIAGTLRTEAGDGVENATVGLNTGQSVTTQADGHFAFPNLTSGGDYTVAPVKDDAPLNGVSTFDLVLISKHILAIQPLNSPYKIIAADVNRSNSVTTFDLVELRKLILHIEDDFSNNTSWRFVKKDFVFQNPDKPFDEIFPETIDINNLDTDLTGADFVAIKVGDVNGNAEASGFTHTEDRSTGKPLQIRLNPQKYAAGEPVVARFLARDFKNMEGVQFTLGFDPQLFDFESFTPGFLTSENVGLRFKNEGKLTFSWH